MVRKPKQPKLGPEELATVRKRDALALAQLIYDIWVEKKVKERAIKINTSENSNL